MMLRGIRGTVWKKETGKEEETEEEEEERRRGGEEEERRGRGREAELTPGSIGLSGTAAVQLEDQMAQRMSVATVDRGCLGDTGAIRPHSKDSSLSLPLSPCMPPTHSASPS